MLDLGQLLPTAKRDAKLDTKSDRAVINEAAELKVTQLTFTSFCYWPRARECKPMYVSSAAFGQLCHANAQQWSAQCSS
jgi:hypothetical protein